MTGRLVPIPGTEASVIPRNASASIEDLVRREARVSGLGDAHPPTLQAVDRRRFELWSVAAFIVMALSVALVLPSLWPSLPEPFGWLTPTIARAMVLLLMVGLVGYVIEKAVALHRLRKLLTHERENVADLSSRVDRLSALLAVGKAMNSELDLREVLGVILESAAQLLEATGGSIMLVENSSHLKAVCTLSNDAARGGRVQIGQGLAGRVGLTLEPLVIAAPFDRAALGNAVEVDPRALGALAVPLASRGELLGVLNVFSLTRRFDEADLRPMTLLAEHAAISIVNARHYEVERKRVSELVQLNRIKTRFVTTMGDELRAPLTSILSRIMGMRTTTYDRLEADRFLETTEGQVRHLLRLIEKLLISALEKRRPSRPSDQPVDLTALARTVVQTFGHGEGGIQIVAPPRLEVMGDEEVLQQILYNLIDNAYKHGAPPIRVEVARDGGQVLISAVDSGGGAAFRVALPARMPEPQVHAAS